MEPRKFAIGDHVRLRLDDYAANNPADVYSVSRALPATAHVWQYRVKRLDDGQERAVDEQQLVRAEVQTSPDRSAMHSAITTSIDPARAAEQAPVMAGRPHEALVPSRDASGN